MNCVRCGKPMAITQDRGVELDRCTDCSTLFFDSGELEAWDTQKKLAYELVMHSHRPGVRAGPACGRCGDPTHRVRSPKAVADVCWGCRGILLHRLKGQPVRPSTDAVVVGGVAGAAVVEGGAELAGEVVGELGFEAAEGALEAAGEGIGEAMAEGAGETAGELLGGLIEGLFSGFG